MLKFLPFIWKNLSRNVLRSALTCGAVTLAIALVCLLLTMPEGLNRIVNEFATNTRISVHNEAGLVYPVPYSYVQKIRALPGVTGAATWTWFGGVFEVERGVTFPNFAVEPEHIAVVYKDYGIDAKQLEDFRRYRDGAIVGRKTLNQYGWKVGELITLRGTVFPIDLTFRIVGEIPNDSAPHFWMNREYVDQALRAKGSSLDFCGIVWVRVDDPQRVEPLMREIDGMFANSEAVTASETEQTYFKNFFSFLQGLVVVILIVTALVTLCIVFIAANTASMAVRERIGEIAVLRALGFGRRLVFGMLLTEGVLLAAIGGLGGATLAVFLTGMIRSRAALAPQMGPLGNFIVSPTIFVQTLFLALFIGMLSGFVPSFGAARRSVAEALREVV